MSENDTLRRFLFEHAAIRGMLVHLDASWHAMTEKKDYPAIVQKQLGEFSAAAVLLSSILKFEGSLNMQVQGDGPLYFLVIEATSKRTLRGIAKWHEHIEEGDLEKLFGNGRLVITLDNENTGERYQGIVELEGKTVAHAIKNYLYRSEQLETHLWLNTTAQRSSGLLIQKMPQINEDDEETWNRVAILASTISDQELQTLDAEQILHRLFHEDDVRLMDSEPVSFRCSCSSERVRNMLRTLGAEEVRSIIEEQGKVSVDCEFCGQHYGFDPVDVEEMFAADVHTDISPTRH